MISAFGVDHGEVSKGLRLKWVRRPPKRIVQPPKVKPEGPGPVRQALEAAGEAPISLKGIGGTAGKAVRGTGSALARYPGTTGTVLVGGGGYAGYRHLSRREPKKKKS